MSRYPVLLVLATALLVGGCFSRRSPDEFRFQGYYKETAVNPAPRFDPLQPQMQQLFEEVYADRQVLTVEPAQRDWLLIRHKISGAITQRKVRAWVGFRMAKNPKHCEKELRTYYQDHLGNNQWTDLKVGSVYIGPGGEVGGPIPCTQLETASPVETTTATRTAP
jgi:hypothetical protein